MGRKTECEVIVPKGQYIILRNFSLGIPHKVNDIYHLVCNLEVPENIRAPILEALMSTPIEIIKEQKDEFGGHYFIVKQDVLDIKKGQKVNMKGYTQAELKKINSATTLLKLVSVDEEKYQSLSLITGIEIDLTENIVKFYLNYDVLNILFSNIFTKEQIKTNVFTKKLRLNSDSPSIDCYIDLFTNHFLEGFYRMIKHLKKQNTDGKTYINNKFKLIPYNSTLEEKKAMKEDIKILVNLLHRESKRIKSFIDKVMDNINAEINPYGFKAVPYFATKFKSLTERVEKLQVEFREIK